MAKQLVLFSMVLMVFGVQELLASESIRECPLMVMKKANDAAKSTWWSGPPDWGRAVYHLGNLALYNLTGDGKYRARSQNWAEKNNWNIKPLNNPPAKWEEGRYADRVACGRVYAELFDACVDANLGPITAALDPSAWKENTKKWWIDAIFMAGPLLHTLGEFYDNTDYFDLAYYDLYLDTKERKIKLYDEKEYLWYDLVPEKKTPKPREKKEFWARGNGWVIAAMPGMIEPLENFISLYPSHPKKSDLEKYKEEYVKMLQDMAATLIETQRQSLTDSECMDNDPSLQEQDTDGFWNVSLYDCQHFPGPETSGTALFTAAIAWGIRKGYLPETYTPFVINAWNDMVQVAIHKWRHQDIGAVGKPGNYTYDEANDLYEITGGGTDIWGTADAFHYVFQPLFGDGEIIAQVRSIADTDPWAKAGVMIRETLHADASNVLMALTAGNQATFQRRKASGSTTSSKAPDIDTPYWVKLERKGNRFVGSRSVDGKPGSWKEVGSDTIEMAPSVYIGLAVTAHKNTTVTVAELSDVEVKPKPTEPLPAYHLGYVQDSGDEPADYVCDPEKYYQNNKCTERKEGPFRDDEWLKNHTTATGLGAFLMAGSEIYQLALERSDIILPPGCKIDGMQAENVQVGGGSLVESNHPGFLGTGFVNLSRNGGFVEWSGVNGRNDGDTQLTFRYALGVNEPRTAELIVNGSIEPESLTFMPTGGWTSWSTLKVCTDLNPGSSNTVRVETTGEDAGNIDQLFVKK